MFPLIFMMIYVMSNMYKIMSGIVFLAFYLYSSSLAMMYSSLGWTAVKASIDSPIVTYKYLYSIVKSFAFSNLMSLRSIESLDINRLKIFLPMVYVLVAMQILPICLRYFYPFIHKVIFFVLSKVFFLKKALPKKNNNNGNIDIKDDLKTLLSLRIEMLKNQMQERITRQQKGRGGQNPHAHHAKPSKVKNLSKVINYDTAAHFMKNTFNTTFNSQKKPNNKQDK